MNAKELAAYTDDIKIHAIMLYKSGIMRKTCPKMGQWGTCLYIAASSYQKLGPQLFPTSGSVILL